MKNFEKKWYILKTLTGRENKVKSYIENIIIKNNNFGNQIGKILVPVEKIFKFKNGKKIQRNKIYYNGYVMIEVNLSGEILYAIKNAPGVVYFLGEGKKGKPIPMRKNEVIKMLSILNDSSVVDDGMIKIPFIVGESVKVIDGPFNGFNGTIEKINEEKRKVELSVLIFGRKTPLEVNFIQIEKI